ncbi:MAG: hypothetical protein ACI4DW_00615, partial [Lachnospiraceae bacterium]
LRLDEEAVAKYHELSDEILAKNRHFCEEMTRIMDGCDGLVDFSEEKRELEELREEMHQMEVFKRKLDEYADEMRRMDNWMVERLSEFVKIGDGGSMTGKGIASKEYQPERTGICRSMNGDDPGIEGTQIEPEIEWAMNRLRQNGYGEDFINYMLRHHKSMLYNLCITDRHSGSDYIQVMEKIEWYAKHIIGLPDLTEPQIELYESLLAYQGIPRLETFLHTLQLGSYNPYNQEEMTHGTWVTVDISDREEIPMHDWYAYLEYDKEDMRDYYETVDDGKYVQLEETEDGFNIQVENTGASFSCHLTEDGWWVDANGRYLITVGPKVLITDYNNEGPESLNFEEFYIYLGCPIDVVLVNDKDPDDILTLECIYGGDLKEHTYKNGIFMNGWSYLEPDAPRETPDGSIIEFMGSTPSNNGIMSHYHVELIIVYDNTTGGN